MSRRRLIALSLGAAAVLMSPPPAMAVISLEVRKQRWTRSLARNFPLGMLRAAVEAKLNATLLGVTHERVGQRTFLAASYLLEPDLYVDVIYDAQSGALVEKHMVLPVDAMGIENVRSFATRRERLYQVGVRAFGSDENLRIKEVSNDVPVLRNGDAEAIAAILELAQRSPVDLVVAPWGSTSEHAAAVLLEVLGAERFKSGLGKLRLLFLGTEADAARVEAAVRAAGGATILQPAAP